jgi:hypothetical protein
MDDRIGRLFPTGGPVPPDLVIGRSGVIAEIRQRLDEGIHTMLTGNRRIGKTTVCNAVCDRMQNAGATVIQIEVPERATATPFLQLVIDRCGHAQIALSGRRALRVARPTIEKLLSENGIPLDLSQLESAQEPLPSRAILSLPAQLAQHSGKPVVLYLDELQRAVDYAEGAEVLGDLVDLYSGQTDVVLLVDGSDERALAGMLVDPIRFAKLCDRESLAPTIARSEWKTGLPERFRQAGLELGAAELAALLEFGRGRPYATMAAARYSALNARKLGSTDVGDFAVAEGISEARRHLEDDE